MAMMTPNAPTGDAFTEMLLPPQTHRHDLISPRRAAAAPSRNAPAISPGIISTMCAPIWACDAISFVHLLMATSLNEGSKTRTKRPLMASIASHHPVASVTCVICCAVFCASDTTSVENAPGPLGTWVHGRLQIIHAMEPPTNSQPIRLGIVIIVLSTFVLCSTFYVLR